MPFGACYDITNGEIMHIHYADKLEDLLIQAIHNPDWAIFQFTYGHPVAQDHTKYKVENGQLMEK